MTGTQTHRASRSRSGAAWGLLPPEGGSRCAQPDGGWAAARAAPTWLDLHAQLVQRVLLARDVHVLPKQSPPGGGFQAGVGGSCATGKRLAPSRGAHEAPKRGRRPQARGWHSPGTAGAGTADSSACPAHTTPLTVSDLSLKHVVICGDGNLISHENRISSSDCCQTRETVTQDFSSI